MANVNMVELEDAVVAAAVKEKEENVTTRERDDAQAFRPNPPMPRIAEPYRRPSISDNVGTLETIQQEWLRSIQEFERRFDEHRKRLEAHSANTRSVIDEMKRLGG